MVQKMQPQDTHQRIYFACQFLARIVIDNAQPRKLLCSDQAHFTLDRLMDNQNCRLWDTAIFNFFKQTVNSDYVAIRRVFTAEFLLDTFLSEEIIPKGPKRYYVTSVHYCELLSNKSFLSYQNEKVYRLRSVSKVYAQA